MSTGDQIFSSLYLFSVQSSNLSQYLMTNDTLWLGTSDQDRNIVIVILPLSSPVKDKQQDRTKCLMYYNNPTLKMWDSSYFLLTICPGELAALQSTWCTTAADCVRFITATTNLKEMIIILQLFCWGTNNATIFGLRN